MARFPRIAFAAAATCGCQPRHPLAEVPVFGGSELAQAQARAELAAFDAWVGPERVRLTDVTFAPTGDVHVHGLYFRGVASIVLDEALPHEQVRAALRHELCHALDWQEGLLDDPHPGFDAFGALLFSPALGALDYREDPRGRRSEALAQVCGVGPFGAHAHTTRCDGESTLGPDLAAFAVRRVWTRVPPPPEPGPAELEATTACCTAEARWTAFDVWPTDEPGRVSVQLADGADSAPIGFQAWLDTGEVAPPPLADSEASVREPPPLPDGAVAGSVAGWPTGPAAAVARFPIPTLGDTAPRLIWTDGAGWAPVAQPCLVGPLAETRLFTADGAVWRAWRDRDALRWAPTP